MGATPPVPGAPAHKSPRRVVSALSRRFDTRVTGAFNSASAKVSALLNLGRDVPFTRRST
jgi:hypothetical protein